MSETRSWLPWRMRYDYYWVYDGDRWVVSVRWDRDTKVLESDDGDRWTRHRELEVEFLTGGDFFSTLRFEKRGGTDE